MKFFTRAVRILRINYILAKYNIDEVAFGGNSFSTRFFIYFNPYNWRRNTSARGIRVRLALEALGPIFVKMGQILSTRRDILPDDIASELAKLQDRVPPFSGELAKNMIEAGLNAPLNSVFAEFDKNALAAASIAQVHTAQLLTGEKVVIKVLRPNIKKTIDGDIDLLFTFAKLAERYWAHARHFKPRELVQEVAQTLYDELDLLREGANASQLRRNFKNSEQLYVPKIYWDVSTPHALVIERIYGIPIHDIEGLKNAKFDTSKVAECCIEIFFTQVFRDSFFHADVHPGNIFVTENALKQPSLISVDFGIVGSLSHSDQRYIAENMIAFFKRDYQRVAELHIACGWLPPDTRVDLFEGAIRAVSEPIFERPLKDISFGQLLMRLFQVARRFNMNIQPQLVLLQKTILNIEGLSRELAPDLDLWGYAAPQIEKWLKQHIGPKAFLKRIRQNLPLWSEQFPEIPSLIYEVLNEKKQTQELQRFYHTKQKENSPTSFSHLWYFLAGGVVTAAIGTMILMF